MGIGKARCNLFYCNGGADCDNNIFRPDFFSRLSWNETSSGCVDKIQVDHRGSKWSRRVTSRGTTLAAPILHFPQVLSIQQ